MVSRISSEIADKPLIIETYNIGKDIMKKIMLLLICGSLFASCPLDHIIIGCNPDGVIGTDDDYKLFFNSTQKYRRSGSQEYQNWFYPLNSSFFTDYKWRIGEPGFDSFQAVNTDSPYSYDPNHALSGIADVDYQIIVECVSISNGLRVVKSSYPQFTIDQAGQSFNHSSIEASSGSGHLHLSYQAVDNEYLQWITWRIYDKLGTYLPSDYLTIVFNTTPLQGDIYVDGIVDEKDIILFANYWLMDSAGIENDYYERADLNKDGQVDFLDFAAIASNWFLSL